MRKSSLIFLISLVFIIISCGKKDPVKDDTGAILPKELPATNYEPGKSYKFSVKDPNSTKTDVAVEYIAGDINSKLILSAPHGGTTTPAYIRTRTEGYNYGTLPADPYNNDKSFSGTADSRTAVFAIAIADAIKARTGLRPHVIINQLHRSKLDANRRIEVATQGDKNAEAAWKAYMGYLDDAKKTVNYYHSSGLVIDIHGNGHTPQRTEVGYLIDRGDFTNYASSLGSFTNYTSIRAMVNSNVSLPSLITGDYAIGTLINEKAGVITTPSKQYPEPASPIFTDKEYFNGGYITARFGSKQGGTISSFQLEFNGDIRAAVTIPTSAPKVAEAIKTYMDKYFQ